MRVAFVPVLFPSLARYDVAATFPPSHDTNSISSMASLSVDNDRMPQRARACAFFE